MHRMLLARICRCCCYSSGLSTAARGGRRLTASLSQTPAVARRTYAENNATTRCGRRTDDDEKHGAAKSDSPIVELQKLLNAYRQTDFERTLSGAPKHAFWTAVVSTAPLVTKTLVVFVTLHCDAGYPTAVAGYVSLYVAAANAWWWTVGGDDDNHSSSSSLQRIQRAFVPTTVCAAAVAFLPSFAAGLSVMAVGYASYRMTCRLVVAEDSPRALQPWAKSLVLLVFGVCAPCLVTALICTAFDP